MDSRELFHILGAWILLSFAFAAVLTRSLWVESPFALGTFTSLREPMLLASSTIGIAFVFHEMSHRMVARARGMEAHFRASWLGLGITIIIATTTGLLFAAPGGVVIGGTLGGGASAGLIAAAGPVSNLLLIPVFLALGSVAPTVSVVGIFVTATLAFFNLLPISPLDGKHVYDWNKGVWMGLFAVSIVAWQYSLTLLGGL